jgi:hypothetical protein
MFKDMAEEQLLKNQRLAIIQTIGLTAQVSAHAEYVSISVLNESNHLLSQTCFILFLGRSNFVLLCAASWRSCHAACSRSFQT